MKWENVYIAGSGTCLPLAVDALDAVEAGDYDREEYETNGILSVLVSEGLAPPEMAAEAARTALKRADMDPSAVTLLLHSSLWFQGVDMWPAAAFVANQAGCVGAASFDVLQQCNGGLGALEIGARHVTTTRTPALLTTGDRFCPPGVDRWRSDLGIVYGDGGTALALSPEGGQARLLATCTVADTSLEQVVRGAEFHQVAQAGSVVDIRGRRDHYLDVTGQELLDAVARPARILHRAVAGALAEAETEIGRIARVVTPAAGRPMLNLVLLAGFEESVTTWEFGRRTGHVGSGDQYAGLHHLINEGLVSPGDRVLLVGGGAGFTCTCAVVEITEGV
ncbi:ketoacyl-ACP synthase III family protein [Microbispora sp. NPDC049125]|uniref:ketoacyl-ACP synthase III family protein n=1 Tax=Microbispora sp. NPDC049125 TaxID=3154929 RepID=UPI003467B709